MTERTVPIGMRQHREWPDCAGCRTPTFAYKCCVKRWLNRDVAEYRLALVEMVESFQGNDRSRDIAIRRVAKVSGLRRGTVRAFITRVYGIDREERRARLLALLPHRCPEGLC